MIHKRVHTFRMEVSKNRNDYSLIRVCRKESHTPARRILCTKCDLVTFLESDLLVKKMQFSYVCSERSICKLFASKVAETWTIPV